MTNLNPFVILIVLMVYTLLFGCQTFNQPVSLDECNLACYPGRVELVVVKHGICKCTKSEVHYDN